MKKLILFTLLIFTLNSNLYSQSWGLTWHNSGNNWINGWNLNTNDRFYVHSAGTGQKDQVLCVGLSTGWADVTTYDPSWPGYWRSVWGNSGLGKLNNDMPINTTDNIRIFLIKNALGVTDMVYRSRIGSVEKYVHSYYTNGWNTISTGTSFPDGWNFNTDDRYVVGNFDTTNTGPQQELFSFCSSSGWATMHFVGMLHPWYPIWSNGGSGNFTGWNITNNDSYYAANVDGGQADELICYNNSTGWAAIYKYNSPNWSCIWSNGGNWSNGIGGYQFYWNATNHFIRADYNNDGKDEVMFSTSLSNNVEMKKYDGSQSWPNYYSNGNSGWIGSWQRSGGDWLLAGRFAATNKVSLFTANPYSSWAMLQEFNYPPPTKKIRPTNGNTNDISELSELEGKESGELTSEKSMDKNVSADKTEKSNILSAANYPNPFNPTTKINYYLPLADVVNIEVYNSLGSKVKTVSNLNLSQGSHSFDFDGTSLSSGMYYYKISTQFSGTVVNKMLLVK